MKSFSRSSRATGPKIRVPLGVLVVLDDDGSVLVEADIGAVCAADALGSADDNGLNDLALLDLPPGRLAHGRDDDIADVAVLAAEPPRTRMHLISLAPVLSATFRKAFLLNHCSGTSLLRLLDDLDHAPALVLGQGTGLHHLDGIADAARRCSRREPSACRCGRRSSCTGDAPRGQRSQRRRSCPSCRKRPYQRGSCGRKFSSLPSLTLLLLLTDHGFDSGNITLGLDERSAGVIQLIGRVLHAQIEEILLQGVELGVQLGDGHAELHLPSSHSPTSWVSASRLTILVLMGSLWLARRSASRARLLRKRRRSQT